MDSVIKFNGHNKLYQLSPAKCEDLKDLVHFHEYMKYSDEYIANKEFTTGPFNGSTEKELGITDTEYFINQYGFRGKWQTGKKRIAVFGDSCTFGVGVDEQDTYVHLLQKYFPESIVYNFGMVGSSIDNIAKLYSVAERLVGFDRALFFLPDFSRFCWPKYEREWQHSNMILGPGLDETNPDHMAYIRNYWDELEVHRTINYLNWISDIARINDSQISVWSWSKATQDIIKQVLPEEEVANIESTDVEIDHARDHQHPGPKSHKEIADRWWEQLVLRN